MLVALVLAACGSSTKTPVARATNATTGAQSAPAAAPTTPRTTTTTGRARAKPSRQKVRARAGRPPFPALPRRSPAPRHRISPAQQAAANASVIAKAKKAEPFVLGCLSAAGLKHARRAPENGVWKATAGNAGPTDMNAQVLVSGPYKSDQAAAALAKSLGAIEYTAPGGAFMATTTKSSHLDATVRKVAVCLAGRSS